MEDYNPYQELDKFLTITQSESSSYRDRTIDNASAGDITLAFAMDFTSPGERLTAKAAGDRIINILFDSQGRLKPEDAVQSILQGILDRGIQGKELTVNIAGNGISTLYAHRPQDLPTASMLQKSLDRYVTEVIGRLLDAGVRIRQIRSGGQTGADEAGIKAGLANCIPVHAHFPQGYRRRNLDGDFQSTLAELKREYRNGLGVVLIPKALLPEQQMPFYLDKQYLPAPLKESGTIAFPSVANALAYLKASFAESHSGKENLTEEQRLFNRSYLQSSPVKPGQPVVKHYLSNYDGINLTESQAAAWKEMEPAVMRSVYLDCLSQNGHALAELMDTRLMHIDTDGPLLGRVLHEVRDNLRGCLQHQSSDGWCLVGDNHLNEASDIEELYNYTNTRGQLFSRDEWFREAESFSNGIAKVETRDGISLTVDALYPEKVSEQIRHARERKEQELLHNRVTFRRG